MASKVIPVRYSARLHCEIRFPLLLITNGMSDTAFLYEARPDSWVCAVCTGPSFGTIQHGDYCHGTVSSVLIPISPVATNARKSPFSAPKNTLIMMSGNGRGE